MQRLIVITLGIFMFVSTTNAKDTFKTDTLKTSEHNLLMTFIGHGTLMFHYDDIVIHIDPVGRYGDYSKLPKADLVLITHHHGDHLDPDLLSTLTKENTDIILTQECHSVLDTGIIMKNGDEKTINGIQIKAVPAYNIMHKRDNGEPYHPKGMGNGYVLSFADKKVYIAGDTENIPEMKNLENIDIAFLPMNLPYTMSPDMVSDAAHMFNPGILYPYHFGNTDVNIIVDLLKESDTEVRIRDLK